MCYTHMLLAGIRTSVMISANSVGIIRLVIAQNGTMVPVRVYVWCHSTR